ncbi:MAG: ATP-binding protein [Tenericutes bacterium]|nr:ATP-binding protein [Mycoplasmatota bacterium]
MKQLLILSGKGGTGKTTIASSFIELSKAKAFADCDVEAPNLHLVMNTNTKTSTPYYGMGKAIIDQSKCIKCGLCKESCRFGAIDFSDKYEINLFKCEGCSVCEFVCPENAIEMASYKDGETTIYRDNYIFSTAELNMGSGNSGKLVMKVKENLKDNLTDEPLAIIDGSPGIGCPVIASLSGVDMVLIVTEPSVSGMSDMIRIIKTAEHFRVKIAVCINKYDTNISQKQKIEKYLIDRKIELIGKIVYDKNISKILNEGKTAVSVDSEASRSIKNIYSRAIEILNS